MVSPPVSPGAASTESRAGIRDPRKLSTKGESLYELLGLSKDATPEEIRRAYRRLALRCHPDKNPDDPKAGEKFAELNRANVILSDETKKEIYDKYGSYGIYVSETVGDEAAMTYLRLNNPCLKCLCITFFILTGCCCCLCCCFCCSCCRKAPEEDLLDIPPDSDDEMYQSMGNRGDGSTGQPISSEPITGLSVFRYFASHRPSPILYIFSTFLRFCPPSACVRICVHSPNQTFLDELTATTATTYFLTFFSPYISLSTNRTLYFVRTILAAQSRNNFLEHCLLYDLRLASGASWKFLRRAE
ncbi:DnaJ -like protein subfamily C member 5B [Echinococcus granulosus]|uniref:DnaJ subfamily C B n=1 Tax=Echinococcus granulosus TaxID=6210 RepID=A0A068WHW9_ECHGR|nr:DnaJ -like protein subfamily C member 5B [Echinococcus granulosus]CDS17200.1 dnaJ subfamily C B [Echinococcus granulosus]